MERKFDLKDAVREAVPLLIGLVGPSGSGKTGSALELAHGIQDVVGGDIGYIDTESNRALHYAKAPMFSDKSRAFKFKHMAFGAPFNPASYQQAIQAVIKAGVKTVVVDSMSHEHEGPGGVLEMHEAKLDKLAGNDYGKRERMTFLAWAEPKAERRALINFLLQQPVNFIFCFRAKEKLKMLKQDGKNVPVQQGWQPIAGEEFVFEMTLNCLLLPGANGVPTWNPDEKGEKQMIKLPEQFKGICSPGRALSAQMGKELALWAKGGDGVVIKPAPGFDKPPVPGHEARIAKLRPWLNASATRTQLATRWGKLVGEETAEVLSGLEMDLAAKEAELKEAGL